MTVAEATPALDITDRDDRAFLGHPKGLGYLGFTEACERFSYYSMQTLLVLYMVNYLLVPGRMNGVIGLDWLRGWHYEGLEAQPLSSAIFGDYTSLVYLTPIIGGLIADKLTGRRIALIVGGRGRGGRCGRERKGSEKGKAHHDLPFFRHPIRAPRPRKWRFVEKALAPVGAAASVPSQGEERMHS